MGAAFLCLGSGATTTLRGQNTVYEYQAEILHVVDGDTLKARVDLGFYVHAEVTLRLARINAPEMPTALRPDGRGQDLPGQLARAFVCQELEPVTMLRVATRKTGKYGRWIAEVVYQVRGQPGVWHNLSDRIVAEGHGQWTPS